MASYEYLTYGGPDGAIVGNTSTEKIAFYGSVPIERLSVSTAVSTTVSVSTGGHYGFSTSSEVLELVGLASTVAYALVQLGLVTSR